MPPIKECLQEFKGEEWKCLFMENGLKYVKGRLMLVNSGYDPQAFAHYLNISCAKTGQSGQTLTGCNQT